MEKDYVRTGKVCQDRCSDARLRSFVYILVEGCRSLPAWETKTQPGQSLPSGRAGNEKLIPCRVARDWKIELGPTMADMWTHRKFVSARIPFLFFFLPHLIAIENCDQPQKYRDQSV